MKKRFFNQTHAVSKAALLALAVLALALTGCASDTSDTSDLSADTQEAASDTDTQTSAETSADTEADIGAAADSEDTSYAYPVSEEEALEIALEDAELTEDDVTISISELLVEDDYTCWSIEFYADDTKYDYEIDANSGNLLSRTVRSTEQ